MKVKWDLVGMAPYGDKHGPIAITRADLDRHTYILRSRRPDTWEVEYAVHWLTSGERMRVTVFARLRDALAAYQSGSLK